MIELLVGEMMQSQRSLRVSGLRENGLGAGDAVSGNGGARGVRGTHNTSTSVVTGGDAGDAPSSGDMISVADVADVNAPDVDGNTPLHVACGHAASLPRSYYADARAWLDRFASNDQRLKSADDDFMCGGLAGDGGWPAVEGGVWGSEARVYWSCVARVIGLLMR